MSSFNELSLYQMFEHVFIRTHWHFLLPPIIFKTSTHASLLKENSVNTWESVSSKILHKLHWILPNSLFTFIPYFNFIFFAMNNQRIIVFKGALISMWTSTTTSFLFLTHSQTFIDNITSMWIYLLNCFWIVVISQIT